MAFTYGWSSPQLKYAMTLDTFIPLTTRLVSIALNRENPNDESKNISNTITALFYLRVILTIAAALYAIHNLIILYNLSRGHKDSEVEDGQSINLDSKASESA